MDILAHLGCGFDVASKYEFGVTDKYKFQSKKFIYSNPNKQISHLLNAKERGIDLTVIDSLGELEKIRMHFPEARMLIRLKTDGKGTTFNFSVRFGVTLEEAEKILIKAKEYGLKIVGTSFHVGYRSSSPESYYNSIQQSLRVFEKGTSLGFKMEIIDIGGGYPGFEWDTEKGFEELAKGINKGIDESLV
jgi:ornithine decarboxylase